MFVAVVPYSLSAVIGGGVVVYFVALCAVRRINRLVTGNFNNILMSATAHRYALQHMIFHMNRKFLS